MISTYPYGTASRVINDVIRDAGMGPYVLHTPNILRRVGLQLIDSLVNCVFLQFPSVRKK